MRFYLPRMLRWALGRLLNEHYDSSNRSDPLMGSGPTLLTFYGNMLMLDLTTLRPGTSSSGNRLHSPIGTRTLKELRALACSGCFYSAYK